MKHITLKQLRAFAETIRTGTVTGAAAELHVTPPAISLQLKLLEENTALPLLEKNSSGFRPTAAGEEVLHAIRQIEAILADTGEALEAMTEGLGGTVRVGVVSTAKYFAPRALAAFRETHPQVDMQLLVGNRGETIEALENYHLDFAVMGRPPKGFAVAQEEIGPHPHVIVGPPDHPLAGHKRVGPERLARDTFLMREQGSGTRLLTEWMMSQMGPQVRRGMELGSNETIKQAVMAGLGIALLSAHTVAVEVNEGRLSLIDVKGMPIMRQWFIVRRADRRLMPAAQALWAFLVQEGRGFLPVIEPADD